jgi:hypothetical protein
MQEILIRKLHDYISDNDPDLFLSLQQENKLTGYLHERVLSVDELINQLTTGNRPSLMIEELCMEELTNSLRPSRFNYLKEILEEEFPKEFERLGQNGILTTELINMVTVCNPVFDELNFSEASEDDRYLRYAIMGAAHEYLNKESSE